MLLEKHLRIILWHHRIELSLGDTISDVCGANHIQWFMDKLYSLYSQSGKVRELEELSRGLGKEILKIGKCLDTRWVASSFRTVSAVWNDFEALCIILKLTGTMGLGPNVSNQRFTVCSSEWFHNSFFRTWHSCMMY